MPHHTKALRAIFIMTFTTCALAAGDAARGKARYANLCAACHNIDYNGVGPAHRNVFGGKAASRTGYIYSPALTASNIVWDEKTLGQWLTNPEKFLPGQKMGVSVASAKDRSDLIAYLKTLTTED